MYNNYGSVSIYHNYCGYGSVVFNITIMLWFTYFLYRHLQNDMNVTLSYELVYVCSCSAAVVCGGRGVLARGSHSLSLSLIHFHFARFSHAAAQRLAYH